MRELALFAGAGGGILGGLLLGWRTVCAVEINPYCRSVLLARQRDGMLEPFPIWDDVCTFDGKPWRGHVDVISGGFPCQDISSAGGRAGIGGERSGLWSEFARIIGEVRPRFAFVENSPDLTARGLDVVLGDLAALGYDARWDVLGARHVGAPHKRDRIWIVASDPDRRRERARSEHAEVARASAPADLPGDTDRERNGSPQHEPPRASSIEGALPIDAADAAVIGPQGAIERESHPRRTRWATAHAEPSGGAWVPLWWSVSLFAGVDDGVASRLERIKATGNGQVPAVAALAWETLI